MIKRVTDKRAVSPVIATVLLIALVLSLAVIIFMWARGFITEQIEKGGQSVQMVCDSVSFDVELSGKYGNLKEVSIVNRGNVPIYNFDVKQFGEGSSSITEFKFSVDPGKSLIGEELTLDDKTTKVIFYPKVLGTVKGKQLNKAAACLDKGKKIDI